MKNCSPERIASALLAGFVLVGLGCQSRDSQSERTDTEASQEAKAAREDRQAFVYECEEDFTFVADVGAEKVWLFLPQKTIELPLAISASGARYTDGKVTYWSKGEEATLELQDKKYSNCRINRRKSVWEDAKLRGVDFRAVGNEPGWHLEINLDHIIFVSDYGSSTYEFSTPGPLSVQEDLVTTYETEQAGHRIRIALEAKPCQDSMSGEAFETTVTLTLDDKTYRGCGKPLH